MSRIPLTFTLFTATACSALTPDLSPQPQLFEFRSRVGWLEDTCLAINNPHLAAGANVTVVRLGTPQSIIAAKVLKRTTSGDECKALIEGRRDANLRHGAFFYLVAVPSAHTSGMGIGIVGELPALSIDNGMVRGDLDGDGRDEFFSTCMTSEGLNFAVWSGEPYDGKLSWSAYYYLDYDVHPTCPEPD
jgi:hypothetical protein